MPLNVGDAVMSFLGDTTNLDEALTRIIAETDTAMSSAAASVPQFTEALGGIEPVLNNMRSDVDSWNEEIMRAMGEAGEGVRIFGVETKEAMTVAKGSIYEARGEAMLLGEMFGIRLPRHVSTFVAKLPGIGDALQSAFAATAVLFLVEALAKGSAKLSQWVANTLIYTQAMKDSDEAVKSQNKVLLALTDRYEKAKEKGEDFGKTQLQLGNEKVAKLTSDIKDQNAILARSQDSFRASSADMSLWGRTVDLTIMSLRALGIELGDVATSQEEADEKNRIAEANAKSKAKAQEKADDQERKDQRRANAVEAASDQEEAEKRSIAINEMIAISQIKGFAALRMYEVSLSKDAATEILKIQRDEAEQEYRLKLDTLKKERDAEEQAAHSYKSAGDAEGYKKELQQITATNSKIEVLNQDHFAKEIQAYTAFQVRFKEITEQIMALKLRGLSPGLGQDVQEFQRLADAASRLGIALANDLGKNATTAKNDFALLGKEFALGRITLRDLQQAEMKALETQIAYDKEMGKSPALVKAEQDALDKLKKSFDNAYGGKEQSALTKFFELLHRKSKEGQKDAQDLTTSVKQFMQQTSQAYATAIMGAIESGQSIGAALEKATKAILLQIATQALAQSLYSMALGFLKLAERDYDAAGTAFTAAAEFGALAGTTGAIGMAMGGAGSGSSAQRSPSAGQTSASGAGSGGANQTIGVTHLAEGGIVSHRTMIGDSPSGGDAEEVIIPLSDPAAWARIANSLLSVSTLRAESSTMSYSAAVAAASAPGPARFAEPAQSPDRDGAGDTHYHDHTTVVVKGLMDSGNLKKIIQKQNRMVANRQATLNASNSLRVTRRSQ